MAKLEIKNVTKKFGDFYAAKNISFVAEEGEFVTLLGPSGCGKTSLLKLIGGFYQADEGEVLIGDKNVNFVPPEKRNTAMCFQSYALFPHLNVSHNICYGLQQKKVEKKEQVSRQYHLTSIYVTHDQAEALAMSDKIIVLNKGSIEQIGTPQEIYHKPKNRFVADFIGIANILEANITPLGGDRYRVVSALGDFVARSEKAPAAEKIYICFRPEEAELCETKTENTQNQFTVDVLQTAFMGNLTEIQAALVYQPNQKIRLQLSKFPKLSENNQLTFRLSETAIHFLEAV